MTWVACPLWKPCVAVVPPDPAGLAWLALTVLLCLAIFLAFGFGRAPR